MKRPEQIVQSGLFDLLLPRMVYQRWEKFFAYAILNGLNVGKTVGGIGKGMGGFAGAADTICHLPPDDDVKMYCVDNGIQQWGRTFYIEIKLRTYKKNRRTGAITCTVTEQSDDQKRFQKIVTGLKIPYHVVAATDINDCLNQYLEILRGYGVRT